MPFTVITLKKVPNSLRGDLSKWMQEIATGVYVGNFNKKIREELWNRVINNVGIGEATLSYYSRNEIGYDFEIYNTENLVVDFDGIPLMMYNNSNNSKEVQDIGLGFSKASKFRKIQKFSKKVIKKENKTKPLVFLDIETDGLDENNNTIIELGAIKTIDNLEEFQRIINSKKELPQNIKDLTGISQDDIDKGIDLKQGLEELITFIEDYDLVGYNIKFDLKFINKNLLALGMKKLNNRSYDLMEFVRRDNQFLDNYKLKTALIGYGINEEVAHRALEDARLTYKLSMKVNKFIDFIKGK
ncbi:MAG: type I-E CRISPR-associated endoribonuclease Cas2e [Tissierellia bacterium]|nr:type I-E CRISPR-associated endoribonuclease Cas2e [Tissierellia bacterium]